jgi:hypothetical protein
MPNVAHLILGEFGLSVIRALWGKVATTFHHVGNVLCLGAFDDVVGIETGRIVASMTPFWDWHMTVNNLKCGPMGEDVPVRIIGTSEPAVAVAICSVRPDPTRIDVGPSFYLLANPIVEIYSFFALAIRATLHRAEPAVVGVIAGDHMQGVDAAQRPTTAQTHRYGEYSIVKSIGQAVCKIFSAANTHERMVIVDHRERPQDAPLSGRTLNRGDEPFKMSLFGRLLAGHDSLLDSELWLASTCSPQFGASFILP